MTNEEREKFAILTAKLGLLGIEAIAARLKAIECQFWKQTDEVTANWQQFRTKVRELKKAVDWIADHMEGGE